jgi:hypothetical protein
MSVNIKIVKRGYRISVKQTYCYRYQIRQTHVLEQ